MRVSVPLKATDLVQIYIPAAEHAYDFSSGWQFYKTVQQCRNRGGCSALYNQLAMRHDPYHCVEDIIVGKRDDFVDEVLDNLKSFLAHSLDLENFAEDAAENATPHIRWRRPDVGR